MFEFLKNRKQGDSKKRVKIIRRLYEISRLEDQWEKAKLLIEFLEKVDHALLQETCRLVISMTPPETLHQIQILSRLRATYGVVRARRIVAKYDRKSLAKFDEAVLELKNLNFI